MTTVAERPLQLAVVGAAVCDRRLYELAYRVGEEIGRAGAVLLTGGRGGVMEAASAGARSAGGLTVGILPGHDPGDSPPNEAVAVAIFSGLGQARNQVLVLSAGAVIAVGGGWGTLSEIALALKHRIPVIVLESWSLQRPDGQEEPLLVAARSSEEAVKLARERAVTVRISAGTDPGD